MTPLPIKRRGSIPFNRGGSPFFRKIDASLKAIVFAALVGSAAPTLFAADRPEIVVADFEGADYGGWTTVGEAFGKAPARGTLPNQMAVDGFLGHGLVNSFHGGDRSTGSLTSTAFKVERRNLRFLIGGGKQADKTSINLLMEGHKVRTATGPNDQPGGSEHLDWHEWDVNEFAGKTVVIEIVDQATGGWGHINIDHIVQTDERLPGTLTNATREFVVHHRYLNLPVKNGAPKRWVSLLIGDREVRDFEMELADGIPDWWAVLDIGPYRGRKALVRVDRLREDSQGLKLIEQSDAIKGGEDLYHERLRPQFHFSAKRGWNNDPNGLVYYRGEYHLFFQHNPYGWNWGNMHWGHAVSRDLVHWKEIEEALYPDALGTAFSGSAVVDTENTTGWARAGEKALVCIYTAAGDSSRQSAKQPFTQCLAYSTDRGRNWTLYERNPVLPHIVGGNRDPKVFWYAPEKKWVMALYLDKSDFALFSSKDLKQWQRLSDVTIPGTSECPEFFEIGVAGNNETRWIFYGGNGRYLVGRFDGSKFTAESGPHPLNFGNCFYASQTYNQLPDHDRRVLIAWGQVNFPGMPFNQMMDFPVELTLHSTADGLRLFANPVREIEELYGRTHRPATGQLRAEKNPLAGVKGELFDLTARIAPGTSTEVGIRVGGVNVSYDPIKQELNCLGRKAALHPLNGKISLRLLVDRRSIEIFGNDGQLYMPMGGDLKMNEQKEPLAIYSRDGDARLEFVRVHELRSAWGKSGEK